MLDRELLRKIWQVAGGSPAYEKLAKYIEKEYVRIIFMTAEETAAGAGVSQGTVSRFCIAMGYKGFNDFMRTLQHVVSRELTAPVRLELTSDKASQAGTDLINKEAANLVSLASVMRDSEYAALLDMVINAEELILLSARMSATLIPYMEYLLNKMRGGITVATPGTKEWDRLYMWDPERTGVIAIGFPRYATVLVEKLQEIRTIGIPVCGITDSQFSPLAELVDHAVFIPLTVSSIFDMYSTPLAFINLLMRDASMKMPGLEERMKKIEEYDVAHGVYIKTV